MSQKLNKLFAANPDLADTFSPLNPGVLILGTTTNVKAGSKPAVFLTPEAVGFMEQMAGVHAGLPDNAVLPLTSLIQQLERTVALLDHPMVRGHLPRIYNGTLPDVESMSVWARAFQSELDWHAETEARDLKRFSYGFVPYTDEWEYKYLSVSGETYLIRWDRLGYIPFDEEGKREANGRPDYSCSCKDYVFRCRKQSLRCKHINTIIDIHGQDASPAGAVNRARKQDEGLVYEAEPFGDAKKASDGKPDAKTQTKAKARRGSQFPRV